jgi:hypothetical protein
LGKEIETREKLINILKSFDSHIGRDGAIDPKIIGDIAQTLKNLRIVSINVITQFVKIRDISSFGVLCGKYDFNIIKNNYNFDRNYMLKLKNDTDFLFYSNISQNFNFSKDSDPFLLATSESSGEDKTAVPTDDLLQSIRNCQFILLQELIYYGIVRKNRKKEELPAPPKNVFIAHQNKPKEQKPLLLSRSRDMRSLSISKKPLSQQNVIKKESWAGVIQRSEQVSKDFYGDTLNLSNKGKLEVQGMSIKKEFLNTPRNLYFDTSIVSIKSKKKGIQDYIRTEGSKGYLQTEDFDYNYRHDTENRQETGRGGNSFFEDLRTFTESEIVDGMRQNNKLFDDSFDNSPKKPNRAPLFETNKPQNISEEQFIIAKSDCDSFQGSRLKLKFYLNNLNRFEKTYNDYLTNINEEQKIIFKLPTQLIGSIKGTAPKLILINYDNKLIGLSIVYYDFSQEPKIRLILSHFSTVYFKHYQNILNEVIEFLKTNFVCDEILVELYNEFKVFVILF